MTQSEALEFLGIHQSRVSDLVREKINRFSIDILVKPLANTPGDACYSRNLEYFPGMFPRKRRISSLINTGHSGAPRKCELTDR
jgi:hypothetical protein